MSQKLRAQIVYHSSRMECLSLQNAQGFLDHLYRHAPQRLHTQYFTFSVEVNPWRNISPVSFCCDHLWVKPIPRLLTFPVNALRGYWLT